jgi:glycosyltransferase involved in cell wall biosynthesis
VQPNQLPAVFAESGCFVLPSRWEPWGVVLQEAAAAGLPIICTAVCGASVHFVQDGYNGFLVGAGNPDSLADAMHNMSNLSDSEYDDMSAASVSLSRQFTPKRWATYILRKGSAAKQKLPLVTKKSE